MVCAHRYVLKGSDFRWGNGICYSLTQFLDYSRTYEPCRGRVVNLAHEQFGLFVFLLVFGLILMFSLFLHFKIQVSVKLVPVVRYRKISKFLLVHLVHIHGEEQCFPITSGKSIDLFTFPNITTIHHRYHDLISNFSV